MYFHDMTTLEFAEKVSRNPVVFLPVGAVEEHGPHLPLSTDTLQPLFVVEELAERLEGEGIPVLVAPPVYYGYCLSTRNFPGTVSIRPGTLRTLVDDILDEFVRNELKNIVVISGHAGRGHMQALREACHRLVKEHPGIKVMCLSDYDLAYDVLGDRVPKDDGHAGAVETSRVQVIRPELVKGTADDNPVDWPRFRIFPDVEKNFPSGIMGYPSLASDELGNDINDYIIDTLAGMVRDMMNE
jgi:creatinine amidohydrolase